MPQTRKKTGAKGASGAEREQRLAAALRENLRKRKVQQRSRGPAGREAAPSPDSNRGGDSG